MEDLGVARVAREQAFQLGPGGPEVARGRVGLRQAHPRLALAVGLAPLALEAGDQAVELVPLEIQRGQAGDGGEPGVEVGALLEGPPEHLDRLLGPELGRQGFGQRGDRLGVGLVEPDGPAEGVEPLVDLAEAEAQVGEELVVLDLARGGGQEVAAGGQGGVLAAEPGFEPGDAGQVLGPGPAVDRGQGPEGVGRGAEVAQPFVDPGDQGEDRHGPGFEPEPAVGRDQGLRRLAVDLQPPRQPPPALGGRVGAGLEFGPEGVGAGAEVAAGLLIADLPLQDRLDLLGSEGGLRGPGELGPLVGQFLGGLEEVGVAKLEVEVGGVEPGGVLRGDQGLVLVAEAAEDLGQPADRLGGSPLPLGDLPPGGQGLGAPLEPVVELAQIFGVLRGVGRERDGPVVEADRLGVPARPPVQVGHLDERGGVVGPGVDQALPDRQRGGFAVGLGPGGVAEDHLAPLADHVGVVRVDPGDRLVLRGGLGELALPQELVDQGRAEVAAARGQGHRLLEPPPGVGHPPLSHQAPAQPGHRLDVVRRLLDPALVVGRQPRLVVGPAEDLLDLAADLAMEPAFGVEPAQQPLEVRQGVVRPVEPDLQVGRVDQELDLAELVAGLLRQGLVPRQRLVGLRLLGQGGGDLLLDPRVVGELLLQAGPDGQRLVVPVRPLIHPAEALEDLQEVGPARLPAQGPLERLRRVVGLADEDERLPEVIGRQGVVGPGGLGLPQVRHGQGIATPLRLDQAEDQPARAVVGVGGDPVLVGLQERVERPPLDVVAVDPVQRRAPAGGLLDHREEPIIRDPVAGLGGVGGRLGPDSGGDRQAATRRDGQGKQGASGHGGPVLGRVVITPKRPGRPPIRPDRGPRLPSEIAA